MFKNVKEKQIYIAIKSLAVVTREEYRIIRVLQRMLIHRQSDLPGARSAHE